MESNLGVVEGLKILSLAREEQCCYSFLSQEAFRNSKEQKNSTSTGQKKAMPVNSIWHMWDLGPHKPELIGVVTQVWLPNRETAQRSVPGSCLEYLNPRIRNVLLHKPHSTAVLSPQSCTLNSDRSARWNILVSYHICALIHTSKLPCFDSKQNW